MTQVEIEKRLEQIESEVKSLERVVDFIESEVEDFPEQRIDEEIDGVYVIQGS